MDRGQHRPAAASYREVAIMSYEIFDALREPRARALIACQIQAGPNATWVERTYEVTRSEDGQWLVDFGEGPLEPRRDWESVLDWLRRLRPRGVELLEESSSGQLEKAP
jgi:hypothetical protein